MFRIFSLENVTKSNELLPLKGMLSLRRMRYENKCPIWNKTPDLNSIYIPQSTLTKWGPDLGRVILYTYQLIIPPPHLMTSSFAIVLHICKKALVGYSRMNWGCDYMTDMSSIMLLPCTRVEQCLATSFSGECQTRFQMLVALPKNSASDSECRLQNFSTLEITDNSISK